MTYNVSVTKAQGNFEQLVVMAQEGQRVVLTDDAGNPQALLIAVGEFDRIEGGKAEWSKESTE